VAAYSLVLHVLGISWGAQIFQSSRLHVSIVGANNLAGCKFCTENPQKLGTAIKNHCLHDLVFRIFACVGICACKEKVLAVVMCMFFLKLMGLNRLV